MASLAGSVPTALAGTIDVNGKPVGIFEDTICTPAGRRTVLTFKNCSIALADDAGHSGWFASEIYDFPEGLMVYEGAVIDMTGLSSTYPTVTGLTATFDSHFSLGSVAKTDDDATTLSSTMVDLIASTAQSAAVAGLGTFKAVSTSTEAPKTKDGTSSAFKMFLNVLVTDATQDVTTTPTSIIFNGTIVINWKFIGDK